jgi:hypothetical protein
MVQGVMQCLESTLTTAPSGLEKNLMSLLLAHPKLKIATKNKNIKKQFCIYLISMFVETWRLGLALLW